MDFFYRNNLTRVEFLSCLFNWKDHEKWQILNFGYPSFYFDLKTTIIYLVFSNIEAQKNYFRLDISNYVITISEETKTLLVESTIDYNDFAISFNQSESMTSFFTIYQQILVKRQLIRLKS